ncbi:MAG: glycine cleavage T C-terminal barrel domain-containing protein, partial [Aestuariivirgaceae bacterium]
HIEYCHQVLWPDLDVQYVSVTEQWAQMAIAGPNARKVLAKVIKQDLSDEAFPYLGAQPVTVNGNIEGRLFRISFSGELAFELSVPADYGDAVVRSLMHAGREFGIQPYGTEALSVMRIEKGHVAGGELNGTSTVYDMGMGRMMSTKKDYIGRMMASREAFHVPDRPHFVGLKPVDTSLQLKAGGHLLTQGDTPSMKNDQGYITAVAYSPMLEHWIGLAYLKRGRERLGETVQIWDGLRDLYMRAEVCDPVFYDREHAKLHG